MENKAFSDAEKYLNTNTVNTIHLMGGKSFGKYEHFYNFIEIYVHYWKDEPVLKTETS